MENYKVPFSNRAHTYTDEEIEVAINAMRNADPLTQGIFLEKFQKRFCEYVHADHAFALNNATAGLELVAQLAQINEGDEVIIPGHTYTSSAYPFLKNGANIVWADIELNTRVISAETIEPCITKKTRLIVVVHLYGYGVEMSSIMDLAQKHNLIVVEDAAQALGVRINGQMAGTFGDFGVYSFHSHKNLSTLGEGGMLTVKNNNIANIIPMLRHNGHCSFDYERKHYWIPAMGNVDLPELNGRPLFPNNFCLGEVECALGIKLLDRIDQINQEKRRRAINFIEALADYPELEFHKVDSERHNYHLLVARLTNGRRDDFMHKMAEQESIQCVVQYYPLYRYDLYKKTGQSKANCPNTDLFFDSMISFPFNHKNSDKQIEWIIEASKRCLI